MSKGKLLGYLNVILKILQFKLFLLTGYNPCSFCFDGEQKLYLI
jgi:hypothetical protein